MPARLFALPLAAAFLSAAPTPPSSREIDNVAAFARLFGVVRYFYPSDAAADLDWDRFAVDGIARVRPARDAGELAAALRELTSPLGPGIEVAAKLPPAAAHASAGEPLVAWRYLGPGFSSMGGPYRAKRTRRGEQPGPAAGFATLMQTVPAGPLRGRPIRLRAQVRARGAGDRGSAALWLRVDRANKAMGFFDNMGDRPVRDPTWRSYAIEGRVADDAESVAFGVMAIGAVAADFDAVELSVAEPDGRWAKLPVADAGFEAAAGERAGWFPAGTRTAETDRPRDDPPQGRQYLRFAPTAAAPPDAELFTGAPPRPGACVDLELGGGLWARVPIVLSDSQARGGTPAPARPTSGAAPAAAGNATPGGPPGVDQRLADAVVAWNVLRHFYPYWSETGVDWEARLRPNLERARDAATREEQTDALRRLLADARDGHGFVADTLDRRERRALPVSLGIVEGRLLVVASRVPDAPVGAEVLALDGVPAAERVARAIALASGSAQWREARAALSLASGPDGATVRLRLRRDDGSASREVVLAYGEAAPPVPDRPGALAEILPGVFYVDLTRAKKADVEPRLPELAAARGVVFDVRGYPTDAGAFVLPYLLEAAEEDRWMHVGRIVGPFQETAGWDDLGWDLKPASPHLGGTIVFLTDGGAISYAESVMGYVADRRLGTIVGGTTAGTNGNVATFTTPGGFRIGFTGMRVTRHDGRSPHHLVGIAPDVAVAPTVAGVRARRDEALERALALIRARQTKADGGRWPPVGKSLRAPKAKV